MIKKAEGILSKIFGYHSFRPLQKEVIENIISKNDTLVIMPTGGGKSLTYQIPALIFNGITVVVSPLISLMKDQVEQLSELGVNALFLNSSLSQLDYQFNVEQVRNGNVKLLYVAPETLMLERTLELLEKLDVDCITIDEAHCISEWGHDFRPVYREIATLKPRFPDAVFMALTATATPQVQNDIIENLKFKKSNRFVASFNRDNLFLQVVEKTFPLKQTLNFLEKHKNQSGIIYCFSRKQVDELTAELDEHGYSVKPYHAGLSDNERMQNQEKFIKDDISIIVATVAFGMGINKPNVRFVIHYDLPKNIESYYQEIGRAGRDGLRADCLLLFGYGDINKINYFIDQKEGREKLVAKQHLDKLIRYAETYTCRRIPLLTYFGEEYYQENCGICDNCNRGVKELTDITVESQKFMSCVKRTGEIFGAMHIVDILLGSKNQKVLDKNHDKLSTYGIGKEHPREVWLSISHQLIVRGLLTKDFEFGGLQITDRGYAALKGEVEVKGKLDVETKFESKSITNLEYDKKLFGVLRSARKNIADKSGLPPYAIFPDKTLIEMATFFPTTEKDMKNIHGIGEAKYNKYGAKFILFISNYCQKFNIPVVSSNIINKRNVVGGIVKKLKYKIIGEEFKSGKSVDAILNEYNMKIDTLVEHLSKYSNLVEPINPVMLFNILECDKRTQKIVYEQFEKLGVELLRPVFDAMNETVSYIDLRILRLNYLFQNKN
ncbi:MAG: DNA helicase RecQ [Bacteroidetes bacterium]|nr:DNA helicase RecQ [Bacteroidota bacterium]MBU1116586.1 DNA helicase RecQ [Bacteroidota bacterium]MBU1797192.1 DNA helicase RecQ [Bacteroidota bacterium]